MWLELFNQMRKNAKMSLDELSAASGVPKGTLAKISSGITRNPSIETMLTLVHTLGYRLGDLDEDGTQVVSAREMEQLKKYRVLDVQGQKLVNTVLQLEYDRMTFVTDREQKGWVTYINCYDLAVSAGTGEPLGDTYYTTRLELPTERVPENAHCCVRVNGNSMEPAYKDGDIVFVERVEEPVRVGEIGIFTFNGEGYMKRLANGALVSLNPAYPPILIHAYDDLRCQGRVLGRVPLEK